MIPPGSSKQTNYRPGPYTTGLMRTDTSREKGSKPSGQCLQSKVVSTLAAMIAYFTPSPLAPPKIHPATSFGWSLVPSLPDRLSGSG